MKKQPKIRRQIIITKQADLSLLEKRAKTGLGFSQIIERLLLNKPV